VVWNFREKKLYFCIFWYINVKNKKKYYFNIFLNKKFFKKHEGWDLEMNCLDLNCFFNF